MGTDATIAATRLSPAARALLVIIKHHCRGSGVCFASQETLAEELGRSSRSVRRYLNELLAADLIREEKLAEDAPTRPPVATLRPPVSATRPPVATIKDQAGAETWPPVSATRPPVAATWPPVVGPSEGIDDDEIKSSSKTETQLALEQEGIGASQAQRMASKPELAAVVLLSYRTLRRLKGKHAPRSEGWMVRAWERPEDYKIEFRDGVWQAPPEVERFMAQDRAHAHERLRQSAYEAEKNRQMDEADRAYRRNRQVWDTLSEAHKEEFRQRALTELPVILQANQRHSVACGKGDTGQLLWACWFDPEFKRLLEKPP
jgi:hypothetical protein